MKTFVIATVAMFTYGCSFVGNAQAQVEFEVDDFKHVAVSIEATVYISQSNNRSVRVEGPGGILDDLEIEVDQNTLKIKKKWTSNKDFSKVSVFVSNPEFEEFSLAGSGDIIANESLTNDVFEISLSGSGDIKLRDITCRELEISIAGSGDVNLGGENIIEETEISIAGSGNVSASEMNTRILEVSISGSGDCRIGVIEKVEAGIVGSGSVLYKGNPKVESSIIGSGNVRRF